jgi:cell division protein FtsQ
MNFFKRYNFKKIFIAIFWVSLGVSVIVLFGAAVRQKDKEHCSKVLISITGASNNIFIDKTDVLNLLASLNLGKVEGRLVKELDLGRIERALEKNEWIRNAEVYFDNNQVLSIKVYEREPIARIFSTTGTTFYIDTSLAIIPLSEKSSARLPVFTGFAINNTTPANIDTAVLKDIRNMSTYIVKDSFWMAQIDQVNILKDRSFELVPKVGNQVILFGTIENYIEKFDNLRAFYSNVISKVGLNKYSRLNLQYKDQVVATVRGMEEVQQDSLRTAQIMLMIQDNVRRQSEDTTNVQLTQRDENIQQVIPIIINMDLSNDSSELKHRIDSAALLKPKQQQTTNKKPQTIIKPQPQNKKP